MDGTKSLTVIRGLNDGTREYEVNGVKYLVDSHFENHNESKNTLVTRMTEIITHLTDMIIDSTMAKEYVCPAAGKE